MTGRPLRRFTHGDGPNGPPRPAGSPRDIPASVIGCDAEPHRALAASWRRPTGLGPVLASVLRFGRRTSKGVAIGVGQLAFSPARPRVLQRPADPIRTKRSASADNCDSSATANQVSKRSTDRRFWGASRSWTANSVSKNRLSHDQGRRRGNFIIRRTAQARPARGRAAVTATPGTGRDHAPFLPGGIRASGQGRVAVPEAARQH